MSNNGLFSAFLKVLVAAVNPFAGGNSRLERSLRARAQPRDKKGRWVETGQGFSLNIGLPSGRVVDVATRSFGAGASKNTVQVYFPDGDAEIPAGFYEVPSRAGDASKGYIPGSASYVDKPGAIKDVVQLSSLQRKDAPDGWKLNEDGSYETLDGEFRIARNAERTGWTLSRENEELKTEKELALAFKEASRLDVEGSSTEKSRKTIAKLRENVEQVRLREGVSEVEVQEAQRKLDRILFDDPDLSDEEKADRLELLDSAEAPEPEPEEPAPTVEPARPRAPRKPRTSGVPEEVSTQAELDSLPAGTVVQQDFGIGERQNTRTWRKSEDGTWTEIVDGKEFPGRSGPRALDDKGMRDGSAPSLIRVVNPQISPALRSEQSKDAKAPTPPKDPNSLGESVTVKDGADNENMAKSKYSGPHYDKKTKTFTPERQALHDRIIKQLLEKYGATAVAFAIQYMKGGGPGSGKSSLTDEMTGYNPNHIVIDPDEIKQLFPEVIEALERLRNGVGTKEDEEWAAESHEESSYLAKRLHRAAVERKLNVVVDGTGDSGLQSIKDKVDEARRNGYDRVVADYLYLEPEEGVRRAELRQKETFRRVPTEVIAGTYAKIAKIFPEILENNLFDEIRVYDNNVERGEAPKLIFEVKDGELVSLNEDGYDSFLKSASKAEKIVEAVENEKTLKTRNALRCRTKSVSTTFADDPDDKTCEILKDHEVLESERALLGRRLYKESVRLGPEPRPLTPAEQEILDEYLESTITKIQEKNDSDSTSGGDDGRGADDSSGEPVEAGDGDAEDGESEAKQKVAESADALERLYPELQSRESEVNRSLLSEKALKALDNLILYRQKTLDAMRLAAYSSDSDRESKFEFNYTVASRVATAINELVDAFVAGRPDKEVSFLSSSENLEARIQNMRIIPSSIKTAEGSDPNLPGDKKFISEADAIFISSQGVPYFMTWRSGYGVKTYQIDEDGSVSNIQAASIDMGTGLGSGGSAYHLSTQEADKPVPVSVGMIKTNDAFREQGIANYMVVFARWASEKSRRIFEHSHHLLPLGNLYSKKVSRRLEYHHRSQREKFIYENYGKDAIPLFKAMDKLGWLSDRSLSFYGSTSNNFKGSHVIKDPVTGKDKVNPAQLSWNNEGPLYHKFSALMFGYYNREREGLAHLVREAFHGKNAVPGEDYPAFFEKHVTGEKEDWSEFDIQTMLLRTVYKNGPSKEEVIQKLISQADELESWANNASVLNTPGDVNYPSTFRNSQDTMKNKALQYAADARKLADSLRDVDFPEDERIDEPPAISADRFKFFDSPFEGNFTDFKVPEGVKPVEAGPTFRERVFNFANLSSAELADIPEWAKSENPALLAQNFTYEELAGALRTAIVNNKDGSMVSLTKDGFTQEFQGGAIYRAIENMGLEAPGILAEMYDSVSGLTENEDSYNAWKKKVRNAQSDLDKLQAELTGDMAEPTEFDNIEGTFSELFGVLFSGLERRKDVLDDSKLPPGQRLSPLSGSNAEYGFMGDGGSRVSLSRGAYLAQRSAQEWAILGISDNPRVMARNFNTEGLQSALLSSISLGKSSVRLRYPNNKIIDVPLEAVRDALQYQGVDTNDLLRSPSFSALRVRALVTTKLVDRQNVGGVVEHVIDIGSSRGNLVASVARTDALAPPRPPDASLVSLAMRSGGDDVVFADIKSFVSDLTGETLYRVRYAHPALVSRDGLDDSDDKNVREAVFETQSQAAANLHRVAVRDLFLQTSSIMPLQDMSSFGDRNPRETSSFREISVTENESASGNVPVRVRVLAFDELQARSLLIREFADGSARFAVQQITADGERFEIKVGAMEAQSIDVGGSPREVFQTSTSRTELGQSNRGSRIFASRNAALDDISLSVATILGAPNQNLNRLGVDDSSTEEAQPTSAVFEGEVFTPSRDEVAGSGVVTLNDGQIGEFTSNLNLRKRPRYRIGAASPFVYADFTVSVGGSVLYKAKVSLTGRSTWTAQITDSQGAYLLSPKSVRNGSVDENASKALLLLKTELSSRFGLSSDDLQRMFPRGESVAGPTTEAPQKDAAEVVIPDGVATSSNAVRLNENIDGLDESGMLERVNEANSRFNDNRLNFSGNWGANDSASEIARKMRDSGYSNVEIDDYGRRVNFTTPSGISGSVRASGVGFDTSGLVQRRSLAHQIYNVLGIPSYSGGQISTPSGGLFAFDLPENTDLGGAVSQPLLLSEGNSPDTGAREEGLTWFNMNQDSADLQKARKDLQRSRVMQMLFGTEELFSSQVSHQMIRDENGDFRVALADGMFALDRTSGLDVGGHIEWLYSPEFRDALSSGNFDSVSAEKFGNTSPQELKELIEKHVLPFTPNVIRRVVGSYIGDSSEAEAVSSRLIDRRKQMLELFGVSDPSVAEAVAVVSTPDASASPTPESTPIPVPDLGEGTVLLSSSEFTLPNDARIAVAHYENELGTLKVVYDSEGRQVARVEFVNAFNGDVRAKIYPGDVGSATDNGRAREVILSRDAFPDLTPEQIFSLAANWTSVEFSGRGDLGFKYLFDEGAESFADLPNFDTSYEELFISAGIVPARGANLNPAGSESRRTLQVLLDGRNVDEQKREMYQRAIDADDLNVNAVDVLYSRLTREPVRSSPAPKKGGDAVSSGSASDLDSQRNVNETRRVRVSDLKPGDYIAGNGEVLFVSSPLRRPYNAVNVHLVDANGQARIWQVDSTGIVPVLNVNPPEEFSGEPNPVVAFRNEGNKTLDDLKAEYPGHRVLPNGDVLLSQRDYQEKSRLRRTFRFEVVVHRTEAEEFVAYARRYEIDPATGEKIGPSESAALQAPAHSSVALINRSRDLINILKPEQDGGRKNPASWFSNKSPEPEIIDPRTGMPLPASLIPSRAEGEIPGTGINKTGDGLKDALISYISSLVDRGLPADSIIARLARQKDSEGNSVFSDDELVDLVDRVQFAKRFPLQPIPYLSRDGKTLIKPGDRVKHYDAQGNYLKSGTVMSRVGVKPYRKPNGTYEYRDLLLVKVDGGRTYELVARRLEVISADGGGDDGSSGGSSDAQAPTPARSPLAPPPPPTISEAPEVSDTVVRPDSIQVPQGYSFSTYGTDNGYLVTPDSNDERDKPSAIIAVDPFYRPGGVSSPVQVFVFAEDDDRLSGNSALIVQGFQNFEDAQQWMNARLDNDPRNIADVERAEEPFTPDGYVVKQDPSNPNGYIISLKDEENRDSAYRAYFYKDRHGLYVAELRKLGERFRKIRGDLTTVEQELERIMERPDAEPPAGFRSERDSVNGSTLFLPKNSDDLRSPSGQIFMEGRGDYRASLWFQEGSRKNNDDPDNTAQFVSYDEAKEWLSGELERMSTWSALPSNIEISEVTENTKSYRDPTSATLGFALVEQLNSEGTRFGASFWNSEADAQSRLYRSPDESPDVFDSLADAEAYIAVKLGPRSESLDDFKDVIPYLSSNETALLKTYPDGEISDRALAMLRLKREVLTRGWSSREGFHGNTHIGDISFARLADGTEIVIKKFDSTEGRTYHQENAQTELMASRLFEALDIDSIVMTEFELDGLPAVIYIKQPGNIGRYSGISSVVDLLQYPEARNIALHDFLVNATDRHTGNWLYDDSTNNVRLYPIDHGHPYTMTEAGDTDLQDVMSYNQVPYGPKGLFKRMINRFVVANASPDPQKRQDMSEFKDVFSRGELESANQKLLGLREMYESMGYGDYFENYILPRMNLLLGVAPS